MFGGDLDCCVCCDVGGDFCVGMVCWLVVGDGEVVVCCGVSVFGFFGLNEIRGVMDVFCLCVVCDVFVWFC